MSKIFNYFFKSYSFNSEIESFRSKTLLLFILVGLSLLTVFTGKTIVSGNYNSLYIQFVHFFIIIGCLVLLKIGKHQLSGNLLSLFVVVIEVLSTFFNFAEADAFNFFVDEFYLFLAFLLFSAMFASRYVLLINTILIISTAVVAFYLRQDSFPAEFMRDLKYGINVYILAVVLIFTFSYLYTHTIIKAIKEISDSASDLEENNRLLEENAEMMKRQKEELIKAKDKAEESNRLKSSFLANMSHEIRTPMNAVLGFTNILQDTQLSKKQEEYIKIIENSGNHLLELINDIIDISKLEANQVNIKEEKFSINGFLKDLTKSFEGTILHRNKDIKIVLDAGIKNGEDLIRTDQKRLRQILINLIGNSIKFTEVGTITISYELSNNILLFKVKDTGIGIEKNELPFIFERFRQADEVCTNEYGGTGLGLAISKACVDLMGGEISVDSEKGKGSTFCFTLPYKA